MTLYKDEVEMLSNHLEYLIDAIESFTQEIYCDNYRAKRDIFDAVQRAKDALKNRHFTESEG